MSCPGAVELGSLFVLDLRVTERRDVRSIHRVMTTARFRDGSVQGWELICLWSGT
jgi:hypothetical protein